MYYMEISQIRKDKETFDRFQKIKDKFNDFNNKIENIIDDRKAYFNHIKKEEGFDEIEEVSKRCLKKKKEDDVETESVEMIRTAIREMFKDRQRVSIKNSVTVRDGSVYKYDRRDKAEFSDIVGRNGRIKFHIANEIRDKDASSRFLKAVEKLEGLEEVQEFHSIDVEEKIEGVEEIQVRLSSNVSTQIDIFPENSSDSFNFSVKNLREGRGSAKDLKDKEIITAMIYRDEILQCYQELEGQLERTMKRRQEIKNEIKQILKKELVMSEF